MEIRKFDIGDVVRVKTTKTLGVITGRGAFISCLGNLRHTFSIEPFDRTGKWAYFFSAELEMVKEGPIHGYRGPLTEGA